jgi:hypothetical protein
MSVALPPTITSSPSALTHHHWPFWPTSTAEKLWPSSSEQNTPPLMPTAITAPSARVQQHVSNSLVGIATFVKSPPGPSARAQKPSPPTTTMAPLLVRVATIRSAPASTAHLVAFAFPFLSTLHT